VILTGFLAFGLIDVSSALSQQTSSSQSAAQARTRAIVASFNKSKHAVKESQWHYCGDRLRACGCGRRSEAQVHTPECTH